MVKGGDPGLGRTVHVLGAGGCIRDWLVSPAWSWPCDDLSDLLEADGSPWGPEGRWVLTNGPDVAALKERLYARHPLDTDQAMPEIVEGGPVFWSGPGAAAGLSGAWRRHRTGADGLVDWSEFCFTPQYRLAVAGVTLEVDQPEWRTIEVASTGPVALWAGGGLVGVFSDFAYMEPVSHEARIRLGSGTTDLFVASWQVAFREVRHVVRVAVHGLPVRVVVASPGADEAVSAIAERVLDSVGIDSWALKDGKAMLTGPVAGAFRVSSNDRLPVRVVFEGGRAIVDVAGASPEGFSGASMLTTGETVLGIGIDDDRSPLRRELRVAVLPRHHRPVPDGAGPKAWRAEVLEHAAGTPPSVARALAARFLGHEVPLRPEDLQVALAMIGDRADCADFQAVGLMRLWHDLPAGDWPPGLRDSVHDALVGFKYWIDQPGLDAMCYFTENHQFVFHTAEILAGEAFAAERFKNTGWTGAEHAAHGRTLALEWLRRKIEGGFSEFDSNAYMAIDTLALVSLVDYAADSTIRTQAEALLDKLLFTLAANSWHGIHGAAHGRSYAQMLRSSRFEETAPIMWALWGTGTLNPAVLPPTAVATSRCYRLPELIRSVATDFDAPWWGRQVYRGELRFEHDLLRRPYQSDVRIWRTADAMLASVQDYRSGLPGLQEHVWGATLAPEVQVFATWPASSSDSSSARPNAWAGQLILPRARQHRDSVLVVYPPRGAAPGSTHVWFPAARMDETVSQGSWLIGRVGKGYAAVACAGGLEPLRAGQGAGQEWLPRGDGLSYVATVGCETLDGSMSRFVAGLGEPDFAPSGEEPGVAWKARDGRSLMLGWSGAFLVDQACPDLDDLGRPDPGPHLDNPACTVAFGSQVLEASHKGHRLVIDLQGGRRLEPASFLDTEEAGHGA